LAEGLLAGGSAWKERPADAGSRGSDDRGAGEVSREDHPQGEQQGTCEHEESGVADGEFEAARGTSPEFGYSITGGKVWFTYGGKSFGYIRESYWPGGFRAVTETQTYGEVYNNSPGGSRIPTMNGSISHYRTSTGSRLNRYGVSSPYRITHATGTGFTFSG
jgi:hypothetical protein